MRTTAKTRRRRSLAACFSNARRSVLVLAAIAAPLEAAAPADANTRYYYAALTRVSPDLAPDTSSASATISVHRPRIGPNDEHSVASLGLAFNRFTKPRAVIEAGWIVTRRDGGANAHIFVYHEGPTYHRLCTLQAGGCRFHSLSTASVEPLDAAYIPHEDGRSVIDASDGVGSIVERSFHWEYRTRSPVASPPHADKVMLEKFGEAGWWLKSNGEWLGYYADADFTPVGGDPLGSTHGKNPFTRANQILFQGEVVADVDRPCTQMGNGLPGLSPAAAYFRDIKINGNTWDVIGRESRFPVMTDPEKYNVGPHPTEPDGFHFGGPGDACPSGG